MALIVCPDCGKEVSSSALSCPKCGWQVNVAQAKPKRSKALLWVLLLLTVFAANWAYSLTYAPFYKAQEKRQALAQREANRLHQVVYRVIGALNQTGFVTYVDADGSTEQAPISFSQPLPGSNSSTAGMWSKTFNAKAGTALVLSAQNSGNSNNVWVEIHVDGEEVRTAKAEGSGSNASCDYSIPNPFASTP
jgi:CHASE1-domain containing sensor protein